MLGIIFDYTFIKFISLKFVATNDTTTDTLYLKSDALFC